MLYWTWCIIGQITKQSGLWIDAVRLMLTFSLTFVFKFLKLLCNPDILSLAVNCLLPCFVKIILLFAGTQDVVQLTAILCGVGMEENPLPEAMWGKFKYYPLLLVKGTVGLTDTLISWLQVCMFCVCGERGGGVGRKTPPRCHGGNCKFKYYPLLLVKGTVA